MAIYIYIYIYVFIFLDYICEFYFGAKEKRRKGFGSPFPYLRVLKIGEEGIRGFYKSSKILLLLKNRVPPIWRFLRRKIG